MDKLLALAFGFGLGAFFFEGLRWTVARGLRSARPALWFQSSLWLRLIAVTVGVVWVAGGDIVRTAACLVGFYLSRRQALHGA